MRFTSYLDYQTILKMNKELINTVVDTPIVLYKLVVEKTKVNLYGEGVKKTYYRGVQIPCLITRVDTTPTTDVGTVDMEQSAEFAFLRTELRDRLIYPEIGDAIEFDSQYYEVTNTNEVQLYAGQTIYNHLVRCDTHLMRKSPTQLERPIL